jgi:hypothetical protein
LTVHIQHGIVRSDPDSAQATLSTLVVVEEACR